MDKVVDGTPCAPDTYDVCVNGVCETAGCDRVLDSTSALDLCGVCGGDGSSCKKVAGVHNDRPRQPGYSAVLRIPAGSSNLDIRQHSHNGSSKDDNYLALVDTATGHYILNGNNVLSTFNKVIAYGGTAIEYSGTAAPVERINSSRPLNRDVTVEVTAVIMSLPRASGVAGEDHPRDVSFGDPQSRHSVTVFTLLLGSHSSLIFFNTSLTFKKKRYRTVDFGLLNNSYDFIFQKIFRQLKGM